LELFPGPAIRTFARLGRLEVRETKDEIEIQLDARRVVTHRRILEAEHQRTDSADGLDFGERHFRNSRVKSKRFLPEQTLI
jgi:hypothetical protein